jgi:TPP-dependent pyruvate/acetoin dehydrogenase alpha subunit
MAKLLSQPLAALSKNDLLAAYRTMRTIRDFEERVHTSSQPERFRASCICMRVRKPRRPA